MHIMEIIQEMKTSFLNRYNQNRTIEKALSSGVSAAVQHNSLYREGVRQVAKPLFQESWKEQLISVSKKFEQTVEASAYEEDILKLKQYINEKYSTLFRDTPHPKYGYEAGFRISHAQKSISVYLKHLWCMGKIPRPPQCPVDRIILKKAGIKYPETNWAYVNSIEEHRGEMCFLNNKAVIAGLHVADWELASKGELPFPIEPLK
jgi:hypothetical protein